MGALSRMSTAPFASPPALPPIRVRGRSLMALVVTPEPPMTDWFAALDDQIQTSSLLLTRPIVVDLSLAAEAVGPGGAAILLEGLEARGLRLAGLEGARPVELAGTRWDALAQVPAQVLARSPAPTLREPPPASRIPPANDAAAAAPPCLTLDQPVRSGQIIMFEEGDITIVGGVASGAEVIAGGSIHVYGALRGRAIAGLRAGDKARIFCRKLEAELVAVGKLYRTADDWGAGLQGRAVQVACDRGALKLSVLD